MLSEARAQKNRRQRVRLTTGYAKDGESCFFFGPTINAARNIVFMITGSAKAEVFEQIAVRTGNWASYPTSHIGIEDRPERLSYFLDKDAAEKMPPVN